MASLKEAHRSAALAFSPNASYLAAGTGAGAIDMSFSTTSTLEVGLAGPVVYPEDLVPTTDPRMVSLPNKRLPYAGLQA